MKSAGFALVRRAWTRRTTLTALLGGLSGLLLTVGATEAGKKGKKQRRRRRRRNNRRPGGGGGSGSRCKKQGDACANDVQCCPGTSCQDETCQPCNVCRSGCAFASVQAAIDAATPGATIHLCAGVFEGPLTIEKDVTLIGIGDGEKGTTLDGLGRDSTVRVTGATVALERLRITGGHGSDGGGIFIQASALTLTACTVSGNTATLDGGGIFHVPGGQPSSLTLIESTVTNNEAGFGGGIFHNGATAATRLENSLIRGNKATFKGGGIFFDEGAMALVDSRVEDNTAAQEGGGIFRSENGAFSLFDSPVTGNAPDNCAGRPIGGCVNP